MHPLCTESAWGEPTAPEREERDPSLPQPSRDRASRRRRFEPPSALERRGGASDSAASRKEWLKGCLPADYWRVHDHLPSRGRITIPDRSYACPTPSRGVSHDTYSIMASDVRGPAVFRSRA
jgi:hypothetical protein